MIQKQHWFGVDRLLIVDEINKASVQVDIFQKGKDQGRSEECQADALVWALWVDKAFRRNGAGRRMMEWAEKYATAFGCKTLALHHDNREASEWVARWYERLGYEEKEFGRHTSLMVKQLDKQKGDTRKDVPETEVSPNE